MLEKISVLTVKLEMIKEVVESNEKADIKVALIESLVKLSYDEL